MGGSWRYSVYGEQRDELETDVNEGLYILIPDVKPLLGEVK